MRLQCCKCKRPATYVRRATRNAAIYYAWCTLHRPDGAKLLPEVGVAMVHMLHTIQRDPGLSTLDLLERIYPGRPYGAAAGPLDRLEAAGMVARVQEGRAKRVYTTALGDMMLRWAGY